MDTASHNTVSFFTASADMFDPATDVVQSPIGSVSLSFLVNVAAVADDDDGLTELYCIASLVLRRWRQLLLGVPPPFQLLMLRNEALLLVAKLTHQREAGRLCSQLWQAAGTSLELACSTISEELEPLVGAAVRGHLGPLRRRVAAVQEMFTAATMDGGRIFWILCVDSALRPLTATLLDAPDEISVRGVESVVHYIQQACESTSSSSSSSSRMEQMVTFQTLQHCIHGLR